jgi:hypothetical protein
MATLLERVEAALDQAHPDAGVLVLGGKPRRPLALREGNPDAKVRQDVVIVLDEKRQDPS